MKAPVIILAIVCVLLLGMLLMNNHKASQKQVETTQLLENLTNEMKQVETKSFQVQGDLNFTNSVLQSNLTATATRELQFSNALATLKPQLAATQQQLREVQSASATRQAEIEALQASQNALKHEMDLLKPVQAELAEAKEQLFAAKQKISVLVEEMGALRVEYYDLLGKLSDTEFLETQAVKAREMAEQQKKAAMSRPKEYQPNPKKTPLVLMPGGTVDFAAIPVPEKEVK